MGLFGDQLNFGCEIAPTVDAVFCCLRGGFDPSATTGADILTLCGIGDALIKVAKTGVLFHFDEALRLLGLGHGHGHGLSSGSHPSSTSRATSHAAMTR